MLGLRRRRRRGRRLRLALSRMLKSFLGQIGDGTPFLSWTSYAELDRRVVERIAGACDCCRVLRIAEERVVARNC